MGLLEEINISSSALEKLALKAKGRRVVIALSSGGLRIVCHLPLLRVLEKANIKIDEIWGVSAGSIAGGLWASGVKAAEIEDAILGMKRREIFEFFPYTAIRALVPSMNAEKAGFLTGKKIERFIGKLEGNWDNPLIDKRDLWILAYNRVQNCKAYMRLGEEPGTIEVTQSKTGKVTIEKGTLIDMLRASFGTPVMFTPKRLNGQLYIDGGIAENYPILTVFSEHRRKLECEVTGPGLLIIGVNISYSGVMKKRRTNLIKSIGETYDIIGAEFTRLHMGLLDEMIRGCDIDCEVITIDPLVHELALTDIKRLPETLDKALARTLETLESI